MLAKVLTVSWQSLDPLVLLHMHRVTNLHVLGGPVLWTSGGLCASAGNACGAAAVLPGLLSAKKSQEGCLYCRRLRSIREEGSASKSTPKLGIFIYMAHILKIQGKRYW